MNRVSKFNGNYFKTWSFNMAYILGFLAADGCLYDDGHKNKGRVYFSIHKDDKDLLNKIANELGENENYVHDRNDENSSFLYIYNKEMYNDLLSLGLTPKKSLTLKWLNIPKEFLRDFIRGYYDGDGSLTFEHQTTNSYKPVIQFLGTEDFLKGLIKTFEEDLGITDTGKKIEKTKTKIYCLRYRSKQARTILNWFYENIEHKLYLKRKYTRYNDYITKVQRLSKAQPNNKRIIRL